MKLSSPRTWLIIAAGVLLFAGGVVIYVVKNPPLPPGWTWHEEPTYRVALPPGDIWYPPSLGGAFSFMDERDLWVTVGTDARVKIGASRSRVDVPDTADALLDKTMMTILAHPNPRERVLVRERIAVRGHPGQVYILETKGPGGEIMKSKHLVVKTRDYFFELSADLAPGVFTEADADFLFRSFRTQVSSR